MNIQNNTYQSSSSLMSDIVSEVDNSVAVVIYNMVICLTSLIVTSKVVRRQ